MSEISPILVVQNKKAKISDMAKVAIKKISSSIPPELIEQKKKQCGELIGPVDDKVIGEIKTQLKYNKDTEESLISEGKFHNDKKKRNKEYINE